MARVLQAQFHPRKKGNGPPIAVAQVRFEAARVEIRPLEDTEGLDRSAVLQKLRFLTEMTSPESFERLRELRSEFWSFVEVEPEVEDANRP